MWCRLAVLVLALGSAAVPAVASSLTLETSAFLNDGMLPRMDAASSGDCGGQNVSPPIHIIGAPDGTRSFALIVFDTDANHRLGFVHWVAYGIPATTTTINAGFGSHPSASYIGGANDAGTTTYFGPCPPPGDPAHHYQFSVYALDVSGRFAPGLTRTALLHAIQSHTLATASITGRYAR